MTLSLLVFWFALLLQLNLFNVSSTCIPTDLLDDPKDKTKLEAHSKRVKHCWEIKKISLCKKDTKCKWAYADTELFFEEKGNYAAIKEDEYDNILKDDYKGPYDEEPPKYFKESFNEKISEKTKKALSELKEDGDDLVKRLMDQGFIHIKLNYVKEEKKGKLYGKGKEETKSVITKIKTTAKEYIVNKQSAKNAAELYNIILSSKKAITTTYDKKKAELRDWTTESRKDPNYSPPSAKSRPSAKFKGGRRRRLVPGQDNAVAVANGGLVNPRNNVAPFRSIGSLVMWNRLNRRWDPHCTAWLISDRHIVTSAHCVRWQGVQFAIPDMQFFPGHTGGGVGPGGAAHIGRDGPPADPPNLGWGRVGGFIHVPAAITEAYVPTIWMNDDGYFIQNMRHTHDWAVLLLANPVNIVNHPPIHIGVVMLDPAAPNPPYAQPILTTVAHAAPACASGMFFAGYPKRWGHNQITNAYAGGLFWDLRSGVRNIWQFHDLIGGGGSGSPYIETATGIAYGLHADGPMVHGAHGSMGLEFTVERYISLCSKLNARAESYGFCPPMAIAPHGLVIQPVQVVNNGKMEYFDEYQQYKQNIYVKNKYFHNNNKYKKKYSSAAATAHVGYMNKLNYKNDINYNDFVGYGNYRSFPEHDYDLSRSEVSYYPGAPLSRNYDAYSSDNVLFFVITILGVVYILLVITILGICFCFCVLFAGYIMNKYNKGAERKYNGINNTDVESDV